MSAISAAMRPASNGVTRWRSLLRGDALHRLTDADIDRLLELGVTTIIDLRNAAGDRSGGQSLSDARGCPVSPHLAFRCAGSSATAFSADRPRRSTWRSVTETRSTSCQPAIAKVLRAITDAPDGIVLFHCTAGKDQNRHHLRPFCLHFPGWTRQPSLTTMPDGDDHRPVDRPPSRKGALRGIEAELVERLLASEPRTIKAALDHLRLHHGGSSNYLAKLGLSDRRAGPLAQQAYLVPLDKRENNVRTDVFPRTSSREGASCMDRLELTTVYREYIACLNRQDWPNLRNFVDDGVNYNGTLTGLSGYREMLERDFREIPIYISTFACLSPTRLMSQAGCDFTLRTKGKVSRPRRQWPESLLRRKRVLRISEQ